MGERTSDTGQERASSTLKPGGTAKAATTTGTQRRMGFQPINVNTVVSALQGLRNPPPNKTHVRAVKFAPWMDGSGFKVGVVKARTVIPKGFILAETPRQGIVIANNTAVRLLFLRQYTKFLRLFFHKAYLWQLIESNGEPDALVESQESVREIIDEYEKCLQECANAEDERHQQAGSSRRVELKGKTSLYRDPDGS